MRGQEAVQQVLKEDVQSERIAWLLDAIFGGEQVLPEHKAIFWAHDEAHAVALLPALEPQNPRLCTREKEQVVTLIHILKMERLIDEIEPLKYEKKQMNGSSFVVVRVPHSTMDSDRLRALYTQRRIMEDAAELLKDILALHGLDERHVADSRVYGLSLECPCLMLTSTIVGAKRAAIDGVCKRLNEVDIFAEVLHAGDTSILQLTAPDDGAMVHKMRTLL